MTGVPPGGVLGEHRLPVAAPQLRGLVEQRRGLHRDRERGGERQCGDRVGDLAVPARGEGGHPEAQQALDLGAHVPHRPGGTAG